MTVLHLCQAYFAVVIALEIILKLCQNFQSVIIAFYAYQQTSSYVAGLDVSCLNVPSLVGKIMGKCCTPWQLSQQTVLSVKELVMQLIIQMVRFCHKVYHVSAYKS